MLLKTFKFVIDKHIKVIFELSFIQVNFIDLSWDAFKSNWLQDSSVQRIFLNSFNKTYFKFNILPLHYTVHCTVNSLKFLVLHYPPPPLLSSVHVVWLCWNNNNRIRNNPESAKFKYTQYGAWIMLVSFLKIKWLK